MKNNIIPFRVIIKYCSTYDDSGEFQYGMKLNILVKKVSFSS